MKYTSWVPGLRPVTVAPLLCQPPPAALQFPPLSTFHFAPAVIAPAGERVTWTLPVCAWQIAAHSRSPPMHSPIVFFMATVQLLNGRSRGAHGRNSFAKVEALCP